MSSSEKTESYEEIVQRWYLRLRPGFTALMMSHYGSSSISLADVENIYQDVFIAIHKNLEEGRISEDSDWGAYVMRIGLNMASKRHRRSSREVSYDIDEAKHEDAAKVKSQRIQGLLSELSSDDGEPTVYSDPEAQALLGDELTHTPEPCASIIRKSYYSDLTDLEIAEELPEYRDNGKSQSVNAKAIKARRWLCMRDLIYRVKLSLYNAGIIQEKPEKRKRNGK